jgi:predicted DNA-binding transcriptional regulator YafY
MSTQTSKEHDKLALRLTLILRKLNDGHKLVPRELAEEFNVDVRTIQRDLKERFEFLELQKTDGCYHLPPQKLGKLGFADVERFASLAGVSGLFPSLNSDFLRDLFSAHLDRTSTLLVKGTNYEDLGDKLPLFKQLELAIRDRHQVAFSYQKDSGPKTYTGAEPYALINHGGVWYLAAVDNGQMKAFTFSKIDRLDVSAALFLREEPHEQMLMDEDSIWLKANKTEVVLKVSKPAAHYFLRRKLIGSQTIEKELEDGGLIISGKVAHPNQILPIVRYWLPNVRIISPEGLQADMEREMRGYLGG